MNWIKFSVHDLARLQRKGYNVEVIQRKVVLVTILPLVSVCYFVLIYQTLGCIGCMGGYMYTDVYICEHQIEKCIVK